MFCRGDSGVVQIIEAPGDWADTSPSSSYCSVSQAAKPWLENFSNILSADTPTPDRSKLI